MFNTIYNKFRRITSNQLYFPEIDGIRFLAISLVILFHIYGYFTAKTDIPIPETTFQYWLNHIMINADEGVQLFFVLSGFILCVPFAHHYINNGKKVNLKRYYLRRVTRLEPPYFIAMIGLFMVLLVMHVHTFSFLFPSLLASLAYCHNIIFNMPPHITVVAWSLEIEIQFYLIAPLLFRILSLSKITRRLILSGLCVLFITLQHYFPTETITIYLHIQYFLAGILLADFYTSGDLREAANKGIVKIAGVLLLVAILFVPFKEAFWAALIFPFIVAAFYLIILRNDAIKKVFSFGFLPIIGGMCYSIYLLHYPIVSMVGRFTMRFKLGNGFLPNLLIQIVVISIVILAISSVFYAIIERPFMSSKWTDKLMGKNKKEDTINPVAVPEVAEPLANK